MNAQYSLRLLPSFLLLTALLFGLPSCDHKSDPSAGDDPIPSWTDPERTVGDVHNRILETYEGLPEGPTRPRLREAILRRARRDASGQPALVEEVRRIVDGPVLGELEARLEQTRLLVREGHPDSRAVARMLEGWGIDPGAAAEIAEVFARILLTERLPKRPAKLPSDEARRVFYDVLHSSTEFWTGQTVLAKVTADSEVIAFDALGALGGLGFGVIGSIVGGALYSIVWREAGVTEIDNDGGCAACH